jgi:hypothetical protein
MSGKGEKPFGARRAQLLAHHARGQQRKFFKEE